MQQDNSNKQLRKQGQLSRSNSLKEFRLQVARSHRKHTIKCGRWKRDFYKWLRTNYKHTAKKYSSEQVSQALWKMGEICRQAVADGYDYKIPYGLGNVFIEVKRNAHTIDWDRTYQFWAEDEEAFEKRIRVRRFDDNTTMVRYSLKGAKIKNAAFLYLKPSREMMSVAKDAYDNGDLDGVDKVNFDKYYGKGD